MLQQRMEKAHLENWKHCNIDVGANSGVGGGGEDVHSQQWFNWLHYPAGRFVQNFVCLKDIIEHSLFHSHSSKLLLC